MTMNEDAIHEAIAAHEGRDRELVARITAKGGSSTGSRPLDLFFWAPSPVHAAFLADALRGLGVTDVDVAAAADGRPVWSVQGQLLASVQDITGSPFVEQLVRLAARHESTYDGWGTEL